MTRRAPGCGSPRFPAKSLAGRAPAKQRGIILIMVLVMLTLIATVTYLLSVDTSANTKSIGITADTQRANLIAISGLQHAAWRLSQVDSCEAYAGMPSTPFGGGNYAVTVAPLNGSPVTVTSTGTSASGAASTMIRRDVPMYQPALSLTLSPGPEGKDAFIEGEAGHQDNNKATDGELRTSSSTTKEYRSLIQFDLSEIPNGYRVVKATLNLHNNEAGSVDRVQAYRLLQAWTEDDVTWNDRDDSSSWNTPGGDFTAASAGSFIAGVGGQVSMDVTALANLWVANPDLNHGLILMSPPSTSGVANHYFSSDHSTWNVPMLTVTYACECGQVCETLPVVFLDEFNEACDSDSAYGGSNGALGWSGSMWTENGDDGSACSGDIQISVDKDPVESGSTEPGDNKLQFAGTSSIVRSVDLSEFTSATLSFEVRRGAALNIGQSLRVEAAAGDGESFQLVAFIVGDTTADKDYETISVDISPFISSETQIRFVSQGLTPDEAIFVDNVQIEEVEGPPPSVPPKPSECNGTFRDEFGSKRYSNNDGTLQWSTDWLEINESDGPRKGDIRVFETELGLKDNDGGGEGLQREADLSGFTRAILSFDYFRINMDDEKDYVTVEVSFNGGGSWTELDRLDGPANESTFRAISYDVSAHISNRTRIRFVTSPVLENFEGVHFDNIQIAVSGCATP